MSPLPPVVLTWAPDGATGWGLYGLHLAIQLRRLGRDVRLAVPANLATIPPALRGLLPDPAAPLPAPDVPLVLVSALGNSFDPPPTLEMPNPVHHVGLAVFEDTGLTPEHVANLRQYDRLVAPSAWCAGILASHGLNSTVVTQGYDDSVFHPAPRVRARVGDPGWDGRVLVFSGGKLEYRKGQDLVIAAFRLFRQTSEGTHAVLVTAWDNPWPQTMEGIWSAGHVKGTPVAKNGETDLSGWLAVNGVPREAHLDLGRLSQAQAAQAIRECDVAVFPNRAEGATNMVLAECLALGVPCVITTCTGQADMTALAHVTLLPSGPAVKPPVRLYRGTDGWGETDVETLALRMSDAAHVPRVRLHVTDYTWSLVAQRMEPLFVPALSLVG